MNNITKQIKTGNNIADVLNEIIELQRVEEHRRANDDLKDGELEERLDDIESNYAFNKEKCAYIYELASKDIKIQRKFLELIMYVDNLDLSNYNTISTILTSAVLLSDLEGHPEFLSTSDLYLISTAMISIPLDDYKMYGEVLINNKVINSIIAKTDDQNERRNMCYDIFDYCDDCTSNDMTKEELETVINDSLNIIKKYQVKETEKTK